MNQVSSFEPSISQLHFRISELRPKLRDIGAELSDGADAFARLEGTLASIRGECYDVLMSLKSLFVLVASAKPQPDPTLIRRLQEIERDHETLENQLTACISGVARAADRNVETPDLLRDDAEGTSTTSHATMEMGFDHAYRRSRPGEGPAEQDVSRQSQGDGGLLPPKVARPFPSNIEVRPGSGRRGTVGSRSTKVQAASQRSQASAVITDALLRDPVIRATYLFYAEVSGLPSDDPATVLEFAAWLIVFGRHDIAHPLTISNAVVDALTEPDSSGRHVLMNFVASKAQKNFDTAAEIRAYYYQEALSTYRLGRFLGREDLIYLRDGPSPVSERLKLPAELKATGWASRPSVSIIGFHRSILGLAEDARSLFHSAVAAGFPTELVDVSTSVFERSDETAIYEPFESRRPTGEVLIFCMPPWEMMRVIGRLGLAAERNRQYRIGLWPWETTQLRDDWLLALDYVDEVWAMSHFLEGVYRSQANGKPVVYMPPCVEVVQPQAPEGLADLFDGFSFLSVFDFHSRIERKNPEGVVAAFKKAFPSGTEQVRLILKTINQERHPEHFDRVARWVDSDPRIALVDGGIPKQELLGLISSADAYVSLHRSEGFGRPLAEAMLLGTPVIATQWSGSADYLDETTGFPIKSTLSDVPPGDYAFAAGQWGEPDLDDAAAAFRFVATNDPHVRQRSRRAQKRVHKQFSRSAAAKALSERLLEIARDRKGR